MDIGQSVFCALHGPFPHANPETLLLVPHPLACPPWHAICCCAIASLAHFSAAMHAAHNNFLSGVGVNDIWVLQEGLIL